MIRPRHPSSKDRPRSYEI